jgi:hypothetical protein
MGANKGLRYGVFVILLDECVAMLAQVRLRNPKCDPSNHSFMLELTPSRDRRRFDFRKVTPLAEWRVSSA